MTNVTIRPFTHSEPVVMSPDAFADEFGIPHGCHEEFLRLAVLGDSLSYDAEADCFAEESPRSDYAPWVRGLMKFNRSRSSAAAV